MVQPVDDELERRIEESYDTIPYGLLSHALTHPIRLSTAAALRGLQCAPVSACRVLEIGCAEGGNLLCLAEAYPGSTFVGIDLSGRQVDLATGRARHLGLTNLDVRKLDILDLDDSLGPFDYIIAHGVYSWVPHPVQQRVFEICRDQLAPNGVAVVSYNAYPGWHISGILRSLIFDVTAGVDDLAQRVSMARGVLERVVADLATEAPYGALLTQYAEYALDNPDAYIAHDLLSEINEPLWHAEFVRRAVATDLQYVANTDTRADLQPDNVGVTGYSDIISGNAFRIAVLCAAGHELREVPDPAAVLSFVVGSATESLDEVALDAAVDDSVVRFADPRGKVLRTGSPLMKALLIHLEHAWPRSVPLAQLTQWLGEVVPPNSWPADAPTRDLTVAALAIDLHRAGAVELSAENYAVGDGATDRPITSRVARVAASISHAVTNQRYETVELDALLAFLVVHADGTRAVSHLVDAAAEAVEAGELDLPDADGAPITDHEVQRLALHGIVPRALEILADMALLVSDGRAVSRPSRASRASAPAIEPTRDTIEELYDELPYGLKTHREAQPIRMATAAALRGLEFAPIERCRVLDIGCAEGGNLLPMAAAYPNSSFVGIDLSQRQIELAKQHIGQRGLTNIEVHHLDLTQLGDQYGDFDYIIAHGVYSWVPPAVQSALFAACSARLTDIGLAYVSYNTYPGWQLKSVLRSMALDNARGVTGIAAQVESTRQMFRQLLADVNLKSPYGASLERHLDLILKSDDAYIAHEYIAPVNEAIPLIEFVRRAAEHRLDYIDDLVAHAGDPSAGLAAQQYHDVSVGTAFRAAVLCHPGRAMSSMSSGRLQTCWVASNLAHDDGAVLGDDSAATFQVGTRGSISTRSPLVKTALAHLGTLWPHSMRLYDLAALLAGQGITVDGSSAFPDLAERLGYHLLKLFRSGVIDLTIEPNPTVQP